MKKIMFMLAFLVGAVSLSKAQGGFQQMTPEERLKRSIASLEPLKLSPEQLTKVTAIFTAQTKSRDSLMTTMQNGGDFSTMRTKSTELQKATDAKITAVLNDEQKKAYAEIVKNRPQMGQRPGGGAPGAPPQE